MSSLKKELNKSCGRECRSEAKPFQKGVLKIEKALFCLLEERACVTTYRIASGGRAGRDIELQNIYSTRIAEDKVSGNIRDPTMDALPDRETA